MLGIELSRRINRTYRFESSFVCIVQAQSPSNHHLPSCCCWCLVRSMIDRPSYIQLRERDSFSVDDLFTSTIQSFPLTYCQSGCIRVLPHSVTASIVPEEREREKDRQRESVIKGPEYDENYAKKSAKY